MLAVQPLAPWAGVASLPRVTRQSATHCRRVCVHRWQLGWPLQRSKAPAVPACQSVACCVLEVVLAGLRSLIFRGRDNNSSSTRSSYGCRRRPKQTGLHVSCSSCSRSSSSCSRSSSCCRPAISCCSSGNGSWRWSGRRSCSSGCGSSCGSGSRSCSGSGSRRSGGSRRYNWSSTRARGASALLCSSWRERRTHGRWREAGLERELLHCPGPWLVTAQQVHTACLLWPLHAHALKARQAGLGRLSWRQHRWAAGRTALGAARLLRRCPAGALRVASPAYLQQQQPAMPRGARSRGPSSRQRHRPWRAGCHRSRRQRLRTARWAPGRSRRMCLNGLKGLQESCESLIHCPCAQSPVHSLVNSLYRHSHSPCRHIRSHGPHHGR